MDPAPKKAVKKGKAAAVVPAAAPAPNAAAAAAAAIGNNIFNNDTSEFDELEKYIKQSSFKPIDEFFKKHKKFDILAKHPAKGYSIWHLILFTGNKKIMDILTKYRSSAYAKVFARDTDAYEKLGKLPTAKDVSTQVNAYVAEETRKAEEKAAANAAEAAAKKAALNEYDRKLRAIYEEEQRKRTEKTQNEKEGFPIGNRQAILNVHHSNYTRCLELCDELQ